MNQCQSCGFSGDVNVVDHGPELCSKCRRIFSVVKSKAPTIDDWKALEIVRDVVDQLIGSTDDWQKGMNDMVAQGKYVMHVYDDGRAGYRMADWYRAQLAQERTGGDATDA